MTTATIILLFIVLSLAALGTGWAVASIAYRRGFEHGRIRGKIETLKSLQAEEGSWS